MNTSTAEPVSTAAAAALVASAPPEVTKATAAANALFTQAQAIVVDSPEGYQAAADQLVDLRSRWNAIEAQRVSLKAPFLEGCRRIDAFFKAPLDRLQAAADALKGNMLTWKDEEDRKAEALRRAEAERQAAERAELERVQREAEARERTAREQAEREARDARERAEAAERAAREAAEAEAAAARAQGDEAAAQAAEAEAERQALAAREAADQAARDARERADAEALAAQQDAENAQVALDLADVAPVPAVQSAAVASGVSGRKSWTLKAVDKRALVIAAGKAAEAGDDALLAYLDVNETALKGVAKALKGAARVPGASFHEVTTLAATGRR